MALLKSTYILFLIFMVLGSSLRLFLSLYFPNHLPGIINQRYKNCKEGFVYIPKRIKANDWKLIGHASLIYIGVMTASTFLDTRVWAVNQTWASDIPGNVEFFTGQFNETKTLEGKQLPVHTLQGINDTEYPPQRKVFAMLRYMYENYLDKYEWFMRADDDVYVRTDKLMDFLRTLDSSEDMVVGQGGTGKKEETNKLGLGNNEYYCIGGPGVIMSRGVLKKIGPNLDRCLNETVSDHEDVELGRCILKYTGVSCLAAYEVRPLILHLHEEKTRMFR